MTGLRPEQRAEFGTEPPAAKHTAGSWRAEFGDYGWRVRAGDVTICGNRRGTEADARLIAAAPELLHAAQLLEEAETQHTNCEECEGEGVPELCETCFPFFDLARVARRQAIAKAEGRS